MTQIILKLPNLSKPVDRLNLEKTKHVNLKLIICINQNELLSLPEVNELKKKLTKSIQNSKFSLEWPNLTNTLT